MASSNGVIFPKSMVDILTNPIEIYFGAMLAESTTPTACLVIEGNTVTSNQQVGTDLLAETHSPTHRDLIAGLDHVKDMLSDTVKVWRTRQAPSHDLYYSTLHASWSTELSSCSVLLHEAQDLD
jgi:hypothetical protein